MGYLTPDTLPEGVFGRWLSMPDTLQFIANVSGAIMALTEAENWSQYGAITPEQAAERAWQMLEEFWNDMQDANTVLAGPASGDPAPATFRALVADDLIDALESPPPIGVGSPDAIFGTVITADTQFIAPVGSVAQPSYSFVDDTDTGVYHSAANSVAMAANGKQIAVFTHGSSITQLNMFASGGDRPNLAMISTNNAGTHHPQIILQRRGAASLATPDSSIIAALTANGYDTSNNATTFADVVVQIGANAASGAPATVSIRTSDTNTALAPKLVINPGSIALSGGVGSEALRTIFIPSTVNRVQVTGAVISGTPLLEVAGSDANIGLEIKTKGTGQLKITTATSTTIGATGSAAALPALPLGYLPVNINGTNCKIPYYNA